MGVAHLIINTLLFTAVVVFHYKTLSSLFTLILKLKIKHRMRVVFGAIRAHIEVVWLSSLAFFLMLLKHDTVQG